MASGMPSAAPWIGQTIRNMAVPLLAKSIRPAFAADPAASGLAIPAIEHALHAIAVALSDSSANT